MNQLGKKQQRPSINANKDSKENFLKKLQFCCQLLDFNDEKNNQELKEQRLEELKEIQDIITNPSLMTNLVIPNLEQVINMIEKNIFRPLPIVKKKGLAGETGFDDEEIIVDLSWPHLKPVYELFLQLIINEQVDMRSLRTHISQKFIQEFLELFDSEEPQEREALKNILHRLYAKLVPRRKMIRKGITDLFNSLIHENYKFNGTSELLDIMAAIISGFAVPLREEHVQFFNFIIIPLHKVQTCHKFHNELLRCSMLFLSKETNLAFPLIEGILKYWPFANYSKSTLFLSELLDVLEVSSEMKQMEELIPQIFKRIVKSIASPHLQEADRTMCFFENEFFLKLLKSNKRVTFPILVPVIAYLSKNHWHELILESLSALRSIIRDIDQAMYEKYAKDENSPYLYLIKSPEKLEENRIQTEFQWSELTKLALSKNPDFQIPYMPYAKEHIVGKYNGLNNGDVLFVE